MRVVWNIGVKKLIATAMQNETNNGNIGDGPANLLNIAHAAEYNAIYEKMLKYVENNNYVQITN